MVIPIFIIFSLLSLLYISGKRAHVIHLVFIGVVLALIAAFRSEEMKDWISYYLFWNDVIGERFEYGFTFFANALKKCGANFHMFLFCCAALSISLKFFAIYKMSSFIWGSLLVYIGQMFILQDMIQIRCGIAAGFFMLAIYFIVNRRLKYFLLFSFLAVLFHYSAIVIFPLWFLGVNHSYKKIYFGLILLSYIMGSSFSIVNLIQYIPIDGIQNLWKMYDQTIGDEMNIFGIMQLFRLVICTYFLFFIDKIYVHNKNAIILVKIYALSIMAYVLFSGIPVVAQRISEFLQVVEILLIPLFAYTIKCNVLFKRMCVIAFGLLFLLMHTFYLDHLV